MTHSFSRRLTFNNDACLGSSRKMYFLIDNSLSSSMHDGDDITIEILIFENRHGKPLCILGEMNDYSHNVQHRTKIVGVIIDLSSGYRDTSQVSWLALRWDVRTPNFDMSSLAGTNLAPPNHVQPRTYFDGKICSISPLALTNTMKTVAAITIIRLFSQVACRSMDDTYSFTEYSLAVWSTPLQVNNSI